MISDQDRQIAEETFGLIERSTASGNSFEANLPIGAPESGDWGYGPTPFAVGDRVSDAAGRRGTVILAEVMGSPGCVNVAWDSSHGERQTVSQWDVSMALAEHTTRCTACELDADPGTGPLGHTYPHTCQPDVSLALAEHTAPALDVIEQTSTERPRWGQTVLPTPRGYQEMHLDTDPGTGTRYLYMGNDYVAFTPDEWAVFVGVLPVRV